MPLGTGWTQLSAQIFNEVLPNGIVWSNGLPYLNFSKVASRNKINSLVATFGWEGMIGIFCSGDGGPDRVPDFIMHRSEFPVVVTPGAPNITVVGNTGNRTYSYVIQALNAQDKELGPPSVVGSINNGNVNLSGSNFNLVTWSSVENATKYRVYRTVNGGNNPSTGKTGLIGVVATTSIADTALVGNGSSPNVLTDMVYLQNILDGILTLVYADSSGARSIWVNTHWWNVTLPYTPRIDKVGNYQFQIANNPPGNPPWWQAYN